LPGLESTLARALERRLFARGGSPVLLDGDTRSAGLTAISASPADRTENIAARRSRTHLARNGISPSSPRVLSARPSRRAASPTRVSRGLCRNPGGSSRAATLAPLRQGARRRAAGFTGSATITSHHGKRTPSTPRPSVSDATDEIERMLADPASCSTNCRSGRQYLRRETRPVWGLLIDPL
jgi:bifunctional enzyme CysN/CysC